MAEQLEMFKGIKDGRTEDENAAIEEWKEMMADFLTGDRNEAFDIAYEFTVNQSTPREILTEYYEYYEQHEED